MKKYFTLFLLGISCLMYGQTRTISGRITDKSNGESLPGANVVAKPSGVGAVADVDGNYQLTLQPGDDSIKVSFIGYQPQLISINNRSTINIVMATEVNVLNELVVVGYGTQKKSDLTGAISSIKGEDVTKIPSMAPQMALQGKIPGLQVISSSGEPGANPVIRIRGVGTLNNSAPIYVVDGMILDDISFLNSNDIQSMEVLKDASATAIYGSRGANGVIIVTTKSGSNLEGKKTRVSFNYEYSLQTLPKKIDLLNGQQFAEVVNAINPGTYNNISRVPSTDWQDLVYRKTAPIHNVNFSIAGNSGKDNYYFGLGYFYNEGIVPKSNYERVSVKLNNTYHFTDHIRVGTNITVAPDNRDNAADVVLSTYRAQPTSVPYNPDGSYAEVLGSSNPLAAIAYNNSTTKRIRSVGNLFGEVDFLKGFTFKTSFGYDYADIKDKSYIPVYYVSPSQSADENKLTQTNTTSSSWLWENTLNYKKDFGKNSIDVLAGITAQQNKSEFITGTIKNLVNSNPSLWYFVAGDKSSVTLDGNLDDYYRMESFLFRTNYTYDNRYLLTASFRRDGSTKFGLNNRFGNFPSFALGWNVMNEDFFKDVRAVDNLKLRFSWGQIGNEKISYLEQYSLVKNDQSAVFGETETLEQGATYDKSGNPDLKWETTTQTDIGLEVGFLNNRLTGEFDYYNKITDGILVQLLSPGHLGNGANVTSVFNAAKVQNYGFEFSLGWRDTKGDFSYGVTLLGSTVHNEVLALGNTGSSANFITAGSLNNGQNVTRTAVGQPIASFYGYHVIGVFQNEEELNNSATYGDEEVGDLKFEDINGDGIIDDQDRTFLGSYIPDLTYGVNLQASYKGVGIDLDFSGVSGNEIYNGKNAVRPDLYNFEAKDYDFWKGEGTSNSEPRPSVGGVNYLPSDRFIQDGSFFRLRSATLSYNLPGKWAKTIHASTAQIYLRGTNIFTFSKYTGYTPEIGSSEATKESRLHPGRTTGNTPGNARTETLSSGIDLGVYPITAIYSIGLNLTF